MSHSTYRALLSLPVLALGFIVALVGHASAAGQIVVAGPGGTFETALEDTVIARFKKAYNVDVVYNSGRAENLLTQIKAEGDQPQIDIMLGTDSTHYAGIKLGVLEPIDPAKVSNYPDVFDFAKSPDGIGVMYGFQALGIEYNTKVFADKGWQPPTSWNDIWDPKYKDHVILSSVPSGYAMTFLGLMAKLDTGKTTSLDTVWPKLEKLAPNVLSYPTAAAELDQMFAAGGGWIAPNGSGRISALAATGVPVAMAIPKEGAALNPNWMDVVKHAPNHEMALAFVNFMLSPESQYDVATKAQFGPVNKLVKLTPEQAKDVPYGPDVVKSLIPVDLGELENQLPAITDRFSRLIAK